MKKLSAFIGFLIIGILVGGVAMYLYTTLTKKTFTVSFDSSGGTEVKSIVVECGKEINLPEEPTRKNYSFVSWVDKNNVAVKDKSMLACEDATLTATWKKSSKKNTKNNEKPTNTTTSTTTTDSNTGKTYTCPAGFELTSSKRCVSRTYPTTSCPTGYAYSSKQDLCYNVNDTTPYNLTCKKETINGVAESGELIHVRGLTYYCGYYEYTMYKNNERSCTHAGLYYSDINNKCYLKYIQDNYERTCPSGYYDAKAKSLDNSLDSATCVKIKNPTETCPKAAALENGLCYRFVDPTIS